MADSEKPAKRSRFDQREAEPKKSRFDRRSRSPADRRSDTRERSPNAPADSADKSPADAAAAAAAAAAKISAQLQARKGVQHVDVPPVQSPSPTPAQKPTMPAPNTDPGHAINGEMYVNDGDYIQDIEVNDLRNRYLLTKGSTQKMIKDETGADVTTRGNYYPNKSMATATNPPLYLHITSTSKQGLEAAVKKINELIQQELPQLVDERRFRRREPEQREPVEKDEFGRRKWPEEKIPIELESLPGFNLRAQVVGQGGQYVKHIQNETGCRVQIKGRGSGFYETSTGRESEEDMFLHVTGPEAQMVEKGKELCIDLVANVKEAFEEFKARPPRFRDHGNGYGDRDRHRGGDRYGGGDRYRSDDHRGSRDHGHSHGHGQSQGQGYSGGGYGGYGQEPQASHNPAMAGGDPAQSAQDYAAQYAQYYGGQDPYAAYGGYANYVALYQHYYGAQAAPGQTQGSPAAPAAPGQTSASPPPPPPPSDEAPPPPPPSGSARPPPPPPSGAPGTSRSYSAVPPPPGL